MTGSDLQTLAQVFTERLLNTAVEGIVLAFLVWLLLRLIGRQNSGIRFAIWFSALLGIAALPLFAGSGFVASHSRSISPANLHPEITLSASWAIYLFAAWGIVAGLLLLRLVVGVGHVRRFRRNFSEIDLASLEPASAAILQSFECRRRVKLCISSDVSVPAAIGFLRPAIVFPARLLPQLSPDEIKVILLHELAHLDRWDDWTNLAQKIVKAVFFFHPAVWWIENRLTLEREMACDDMVLAQTASPKAYASSLISFAEKLQNARTLALAQALVSRMRHMSLRITQILDAKRPSRTGLWKPVLALSTGMLAVVFGAAPYAPRFVAFQNQPKQIQATCRESQLRAAGMAMTRPVASNPMQSNLAQLPRAIPAAFNLRKAAVPTPLRATPQRRPSAISARATQKKPAIQATFVILQTTDYDEYGHGIVTLCIWRVRGDLSEKQLQSAIIMSSI